MNELDYYKYLPNIKNELINDPRIIKNFLYDRGSIFNSLNEVLDSIEFDDETNLPKIITDRQKFYFDQFVKFINTKEFLFECFYSINKNKKAHQFLNFILGSDFINKGLIVHLFSNFEYLKEIYHDEYSHNWLEFGVLRRGNFLLKGAPHRKFELEQLIPMAMTEPGKFIPSIYGVSRSIAGTALDGGHLNKEGLKKILCIYPDDSYFMKKQ